LIALGEQQIYTLPGISDPDVDDVNPSVRVSPSSEISSLVRFD